MPSYTYAQLLSDVNGKIKGKSGVLVSPQSTINQGVRQVLSELDLVTTRRRTLMVPNLFSGLFGAYAAPTDLKGYGVISIQNQKWTKTPFWSLVPYEQFLRRQDENTIAISDYNGVEKIFAKVVINDTKTVLSTLDSLTSGGGTWGAFGDAINVVAATDNVVEGNGTIKFDISAVGGTTAGIVNSTLTQTDLTNFIQGDGCCLVWAYITSATNLTNYILRFGSDASNYYSKTVTTQADGTAFTTGWNLLYFDLAIYTTTGSPAITAVDYCAVYMTKTAGKISETGYRFDQVIFRRGEINNLYYYSKYGWQSSGGTYKENSTLASDYLNADTQEYELILAKCSELCADEVDEDKVSEKQAANYTRLKKAYKMDNPSEALIMISTVADFIKV